MPGVIGKVGPMDIKDLWLRLLDAVTGKSVGGLLAERTGRPYSRAQLAESEYVRREEIDATRAYPVPALLGFVVAVPTEADLPAALETALRERVCAFDWRVESRIVDALRKYAIFHTSIDAPVDERRGEPMWLELAGDLLMFDGEPIGDRRWFDIRPMGARADDELATALPGPIEVRINVATYSNNRHPGVGVPFYS
jgi:hypothetical protein